MVTNAAISAAIMYALSLGIALLVAGLIKLLFVVVRRFGGGS